MIQVALEPAVILQAVPVYFSTVYRGFEKKCIVNCGVVERALLGGCTADCIAYGRLLKLNIQYQFRS
jgi:hypothetical protein